MYLTEEEYLLYSPRKEELNAKVREVVKEALKKQ